jgi:hypothetical protein
MLEPILWLLVFPGVGIVFGGRDGIFAAVAKGIAAQDPPDAQ